MSRLGNGLGLNKVWGKGNNAPPPLPPAAAAALSYLAHPLYCFKDAAATQTCGDNDLVYTIVERTGSGLNATEPTSSLRPALRRAPNGKWLLDFNGYNSYMTFPLGGDIPLNNIDLWISYIPHDTCNLQVPVRLYGGAQLNPYSWQNPATADSAYVYGNPLPATGNIVNRGLLNTIGCLCSLSGSNLRVNGVDSTTGEASGTVNTGIIGGNTTGGDYSCNAAIAEVIVYLTDQGALTSPEVEAYFSSYGYSPYGFSSTANIIICDGNSYTFGYPINNAGNRFDCYPMMLNAQLASPRIVANLGIDGYTTPQMIADAPSRVDPYFRTGNHKNVLNAFEGINDILGGATASQAYSNLKTYWSARKAAAAAAGYTLYVLGADISPYPAFSSAQKTAATAVNAALAADFPTATSAQYWYTGASYCDLMFRMSADPAILAGQSVNHPSLSGYQEMAAQFAAGLALIGVV